MLEQDRDFLRLFDTTYFSYHCVHLKHAKMSSNQILLHFSQIVPRVCTLVLFINIAIEQHNAFLHYTWALRVMHCMYGGGGHFRQGGVTVT